jgi:four helix bundle protein
MDMAVSISHVVERLPPGLLSDHVAGQLLRCCTSPAANYAEALGAESRRDFIHKMGIGLKELRESQTWLRYLQRMRLVSADEVAPNVQECDELIAIFVSSIRTAKKKLPEPRRRY